MRARNCKHGFNPVDGPGLWCPACEAEQTEKAAAQAARLPAWRRILAWFGWLR